MEQTQSTQAPVHGDHKKTVKIYIAIFLALGVLTFLTVWVNSMHVARPMAIAIAATIALVKVLLIAFFFMHLKFEGKWIYGVVLLAIVAIGILIVLISPDIGAVGGIRH